jgi:hypothetical protein
MSNVSPDHGEIKFSNFDSCTKLVFSSFDRSLQSGHGFPNTYLIIYYTSLFKRRQTSAKDVDIKIGLKHYYFLSISVFVMIQQSD